MLGGLVAAADERDELPNCYRLLFAQADIVPRLMAVIDAERKCCRFLKFEVALEPDLGPVWLTVTGPAGTRDFLAALD